MGICNFAESCSGANNSTHNRGFFIEKQTHRLYSNDSSRCSSLFGFTVNRSPKITVVSARACFIGHRAFSPPITAAGGRAVYYYTQTFYDDNSNDRKGVATGSS